MKRYLKNHALSGCSLAALVLATGLALPLPAHAASVALANAPLATAVTSVVKPNVMFVLDDSGSMDWDYMPDTALSFSGKYGFNASQCNGTYYNPDITYDPPVNSTGAALNATATTFSTAYKDGYVTSAGTSNLSSGFTGGSGSGASGISLTPGPAFYYTYSGNQTTAAKKLYFNTSSDFYKECNSAIGATTVIDGASVNTRFTKVRLALVPTANIIVTGAGGGSGATITITSVSSKSKISHITVNGAEILTGTTSSSKSASTIAKNIATGINACTASATGNCAGAGYSATYSGSAVTITGLAASGGFLPVVTVSSGNATTSSTAFPAVGATTVSGITVNGTQLLSGAASGTTPNALASDIQSKLTLNGYSATVSANIVTVTGPSSASTYTPVDTISAGTMTLTTEAFPESTPSKLQNFANWYSYYSNRMLMMKTAAGRAFQPLTDSYRVGFLTMNNNVSPGIIEVAPFDATQKSAWYTKLYAANPGSSTPLREALSHVGQYYAHKFGTNTFYKATITVGGSGTTSVDGITVNGVETMDDASIESDVISTVAKNIAAQINTMQITEYGATASGNVVTIISSTASALGLSPVVTKSGNMTFTATTFVATTTTAQLNGISPADPIQYSCQQNFTILSTDGYWNGATTYDLSNSPVGQQDGATAARPMNDGGQATSTTTVTYSRNQYTYTTSTCSSGQKKQTTQPQQGTCIDTGLGSCTPGSWGSNGTATVSACSASYNSSTTNYSAAVETGRVTTTGSVGGTSNTLADVAMYYYQTDLRTPLLGNCTGATGGNVCENDVFTTTTDNATHQHMTTFTLGLGARGRMAYSSSYLTDTSGDYLSVKQGATASSTVCTWQTAGTSCTWPIPSSGAIENIDDLWHAAVNGRGAYFSATDPTTLASGLSNALTGIKSRKGAAAAAATSTLNPVAGNNFAYVASYTTVTWKGGLEARGINTDTGVVSETASWCVENVPADTCPTAPVAETTGDTTIYNCVTPNSTICTGGVLDGTDCKVQVATACTGTMNAKVSATTDTRTIKTANSTGTALIDFDSAYATANSTNFAAARINTLSQWSSLTSAQQTAGAGTNLINYLRGQNGYEDRTANDLTNRLYRYREAVLGDALESQPAFMSKPVFSYSYPGYSSYATANAARAGNVYMGVNDGMMHAFAAATGVENWAYVPSMVIPNMWQLADKAYATSHRNFVNGSPTTSDICTANCTCDTACVTGGGTAPVWKTILVAGLNGGGRGYYALDITNPTTPALLWEFTTTSGIGAVKDDDLGYSFGQPIVTRKADGTWVILVTSGHNNVSPGTGKGYLYVLNAATGAIISKITTNTGDTTAPGGLSKIAAWNDDPTGNQTTYVYGGDLQGNVWRFNINSTATATVGTGEVLKFATLFSDTAATSKQAITTSPVLGKISGKRVVFIGSGKYLESSDLSTTQVQSQYAIKDDDATGTLANPRTTLVQQTLTNNPDDSPTRLASSHAVDFSTGRGWYLDFPDSAERANIDSKLVQGTLLIPTIVPRNSDCSPGGYGWLNYVDYKTGGALDAANPLAGAKLNATIVGINVFYIDGTPKVSAVTSDNPTPTLIPSVGFGTSAAGFTGKRVMWREMRP